MAAPIAEKLVRIQPTAKCPATMADLLRQAIADARALSRDDYTPDYETWHHVPRDTAYGDDDTCHMCLGGAMIAGTLGVEGGEHVDPGDIADERWSRALVALDSIRKGDYLKAHMYFYNSLHNPGGQVLSGIPEPSAQRFLGWPQFERHLRSLEAVADALEERGL